VILQEYLTRYPQALPHLEADQREKENLILSSTPVDVDDSHRIIPISQVSLSNGLTLDSATEDKRG
jgi:hypothetical protein